MRQPNDTGVGETLLFFPATHRDQGAYLKNLLLFYDDVCLVAPKKTLQRAWNIDEAIYGPLQDAKILTEPSIDTLLDKSLLHTDINNAMPDSTGMVRLMLEEMWRIIQADETASGEGGVLDILTPTAFMLLYNCALRRNPKTGNLLSPGTDTPELAKKAQELWASANPGSMARVVEMDVQQVGIDTGSIPMDEYLAFRAENRSAHRRYMQAVRGFFEQLNGRDNESQSALLAQRKQEIADYGADLNRATIRSMAEPASLLVGIGGVVWSAATLDPTGAFIGMIAVTLGAIPQKDHGTYSYLFSARNL